MRYQYKREPLTEEEANRLANTCSTHEEKLVIWTLLDTGLRVAELANLIKRISPIAWRHVNFLGRFEFQKQHGDN